MAKNSFTESQWRKVVTTLNGDEAAFGLPERRDKSVVLASFNIRKLGKKSSKSAGAWDFLAHFIARCDLIAIQEVQDNLEALTVLKDKVNALSGDKYGLVVSDVTGWNAPAKSGLKERLAFLFRWDRVERTEVASDITIDRSTVIDTLYGNRAAFADAFGAYQSALKTAEDKHAVKLKKWLADGKTGKKPSLNKPPFVLPRFLTFIRTPHCVSFRIKGKPSARPYEFLAVNAHLLYGDKSKQAEERRMEFFGLMDWLSARAKAVKTLYHKDLILFGDLNLDLDDPVNDRAEIDGHLTGLNEGTLKKTGVRANMPFLDAHPGRPGPFRSNARMNQTYDQIALFMHDKRLPTVKKNADAGQKGPDAYDYGMFDFVDVFAMALKGKAFKDLSKVQKSSLISHFEYDVSDHMPIWIRLPLP